jgi:DNA-binding NtrC family response regulator
MARLLIIDDEESLCRVLEIAFGKRGHMVDTATTGQAAKEKIDSQPYDIILADIRLPDATGLELLEHARDAKIRTPFILITAVPTMSTAIQAVNLGAYRYVIKTDSLVEELCSVVERVLGELALREENLRLHLAPIAGSITGIAATGQEEIQIPAEGFEFERHVAQVEKQYLQAALQSAGGERREAAALLKMSYRSFGKYAKKYGI